MENFKRFDKWYSKHVIDNHKAKVTVNIKNLSDYSWNVHINFKDDAYRHMKNLFENKQLSNYNHYSVKAEKGDFKATGDFTKLDFLMGKFLSYIGEFDSYSFEKDYFLMPDIHDFIFKKSEDDYVFLHYTTDDTVARKIIDTGFKFCSFDKTTTKTQNDIIDLNYNHLVRKPFGKFVIVICISKEIYGKYLELINKSKNHYLKVEEILNEEKHSENESGELVYILHSKFIKGYFNYNTGVIVENPDFDSNYDSEKFIENIK
ncbi:MAG: hypothetical protein GXO80_01765 [Chlorobi bacterium]|nr:hypothetical protein [Chlorobiota bacterium]